MRLWNIDRLPLVWLYRLYPSLLDAIIIAQPETVIRWHQRGFHAYWRWKSRCGRPRIDSEIRALIRRMTARTRCGALPDDYVFKNTLGRPIDQRSFYKIFCGLQRVLDVRLRDLYATKDT